ncbi:tumor necrosis factor ligand superfamily member 11 [Anomaloglossus baeobatrachus]|uniref:tumor necrosis factor ligand superfamily member 11 n=1 Tax=Anomaloglossus baeobatrachus TaxID=238106 RepID=UPI003F4F9151
MSPSGYLRGAAELGGPPEIRDRGQTFPRSVFLALLLLALLQVGCTLGLFFYVKAQVEPFAKADGNVCEGTQLAINRAVEKAVQGLSQKQFHIGNEIMPDPVLSRIHNHETWPAAHLTLGNSTSGDSTIVHLRSWNHKEGWGNIQNMSYNNGTLKVLQDGFYFVYANICFRHHKGAPKTTQSNLQLMLYVCKLKKSGQSPENLLKGGSTTVWSTNSTFNLYSVYQGGIFKLLAGEEIFIKASNPALLDPAQEATYFGAFKILDIHL